MITNWISQYLLYVIHMSNANYTILHTTSGTYNIELLMRLYCEINALAFLIVSSILLIMGIFPIIQKANVFVLRMTRQYVLRIIVLEFIFMSIPTIIIIYMLVPTISYIYRSVADVEAIALIYEICGKQWFWVLRETICMRSISVSTSSASMYTELRESARLLTTGAPLIIPVCVAVLLRIVSYDVIHSVAFPMLGIKVDAVPGKVQEIVLQIARCGIYRGQCSELCGVLHGMMPLEIYAVAIDQYVAYVASYTKVWYLCLDAYNYCVL